MLFPAWRQLSLWPDLALPPRPRADSSSMSDEERDRRTPGQWLRAVRAYLDFMTGDAWRRTSDRFNPERVWYNRHRGESRLSSPATPPDKRVRIRRFGWIELFPNVQPWKYK